MNILKEIPFSYYWILRKTIGDPVKRILDLGCADGALMKVVSEGKNWEITGIELYKDYIKKGRSSDVYKKIVKADVKRLPSFIKKNKFDVVIASQVIEHLKKEDGEKALDVWEKLAKKRIVISTPIGFINYYPIEGTKKEKNTLQQHLSGWFPQEFTKRGYKVYGQGLRFVYGEKGIIRKFPSFFRIFSLIAFLFSPLVYFFPKLGTYMIARKEQ